MIKNVTWSTIIGILLIIVIFIIVYKMKENFVLTAPVYDPNIYSAPTPTADELSLINKIVDDVEICFNPAYVSTLTSSDLNNLTSNFRNIWKPLILEKIKNKVYYDGINKMNDPSLNVNEPFMSVYYKDVLKNITNAYCLTSNNNYNTFNTIYDNEMNMIVNNLECLIKKIKFIYDGTTINEISINRQELLYQVKCIQMYIFDGLNNQMSDPYGFYEELYDLVINTVENNGLQNFCKIKTNDVVVTDASGNPVIDPLTGQAKTIVRLNRPIKKPTMNNCADLSGGFTEPPFVIDPTGEIISGVVPTNVPVSTTVPTTTPTTSTSSTPSSSTSSTPSSTSSTPSSTSSTQSSTQSSTPSSTQSSTPSSTSSPTTMQTTSITPTSAPTIMSTTSITPTRSSLNTMPITYTSSTPNTISTPIVPFSSSETGFGDELLNMFGNYLNGYGQTNSMASANFDMVPQQPDINLISSKGPNNFFIPNIWIEE
jgi:hypothetical protein